MRPTDPRLLRRLAPARGPLVGVLASGLLAALLVIAQAFAVTGLVVAAVQGDPLTGWALATAAVLAGRGLVGWAGDVLAARAAARVGTSVRRDLVEQALLASGSEASGSTALLVTRGVSALEPYLTRYLPALALAAVLPGLTVLAIASQDLTSALVVVLTLPLVPVFGALVGLATRDRAERQWRALSSLAGHFLDVVRGLPTLVAFGRAEAQSATIRRVTDRYRRRTTETLRIAFASSAVLELVATLSVALVAVTVGLRLAQGHLDLGTALVVLLLAPEAYWPLRRVGAEFHAAAEGVATFEQVSGLLDGTASPAESRGPAYPGASLVVSHLTVRHPGRTVPALDGFSTVIPARGLTALTGPSGCGKSTLLAVLAGLLEPSEGSLTCQGQVVGGPEWQRQVAWSPQRPGFVAGSVRDNLLLGRPHATEAAVWEALAAVALEVRVRDLPAGLDTPLGEDGAGLSAGERARLALARVVLADRPWVLLDEPTAHLDDLTERIVADTLVDLARDRAVVVVAHRPWLAAIADQVVRLPAPARRPARPELGSCGPACAPAHPEPHDPQTHHERRGLALPTLLGGLASASGVALTATAGWLIVQASTRPPVLTLMVAIVAVRTFGLARPVLRYAERLRSHDVVLRLLAERRVQVYDALVPLVPGALGRRRGDLLTSVVEDVDAELDHELRVRMPVRGAVLVAALAAVVAGLLAPRALVGVAALVAAAAAAYVLARAGAARGERAAVTTRARLSDQVLEAATLAEELTLWQAQGRAASAVAATSEELWATATRTAVWAGAARALLLATTGASVAVTAVLVAPLVAAGDLRGPVLALLVLLPLALVDVLVPLADAGTLSARTRAAQERVEDLLDRAPAVSDAALTQPTDGSDLALVGVSAGWGGATALSGLALAVPAGRRIAVVGPSGCGKSTLAAVLLRFIDPVSGTVTLGGTSMREAALADVRRTVGLVDDDPHVFASTLVENVRLARPGAPDDDVEQALRAAALGPWLDSLPDGLHTWLGDGHAGVSGGERARLAVARSLLADQRVLVLDEPTAHLDEATAQEVAEELLLGTGRSVIWITHAETGLDLVEEVVDLGRTRPEHRHQDDPSDPTQELPHG